MNPIPIACTALAGLAAAAALPAATGPGRPGPTVTAPADTTTLAATSRAGTPADDQAWIGSASSSAGVPIIDPGVRTLFLERGPGGGSTAMNVAYHPGFDQYYASNGGNPGFSAWVYDGAGNRIQDLAALNIDARSWNYNPNDGRLEVLSFDAQNGDGGNVRGLLAPGVDGSGLLTGGTTNLLAALPGLNGNQTMPAFDPADNVFYSRDRDETVNVVSRANGALVGTITLDFAAAGITSNDDTDFTIGFDRTLRCLVVTDATNNRALVFGLDGAFIGASRLDVNVPASFQMGYANGQLWVFDGARNGWQGYQIKAGGDPCADCECFEDIDRDGMVGFSDILRILTAWGPCPGSFGCDTPGTCDNFTQCTDDPDCICTTDFAGNGQCYPGGTPCGDPCPDGTCPPGFLCLVNTCCGETTCVPDDAGCPTGAAPRRLEPGTRVIAGVIGADGHLAPRAAAPSFGALGEFPARSRAAADAGYVDEGITMLLAEPGRGLSAALAARIAASGGPVTLDSTFPGRGWFNDVGLHIAGNDNTFTGTVNPDPQSGSGRGLNSFYAYDVSGLSGLTVLSIDLRFGQDDYFSTDNAERIQVYDVSTTRAALEADYARNDPNGIQIHDDLETGNLYGGFTATPGQGNIYTTTLSADAVADMNAAIGGSGEFSIGLHNSTDSLIRQDGVRFDLNPRVHQLILTVSADPCDQCPCREDLDRDGMVGFSDILRVLTAWGPCPGSFGCDTPGTCDNFTQCTDDPDCICTTDFAGNGQCYPGATPCGDPCPDGTCPPGFLCLVNTCCGETTCVPDDAGCPTGAAPRRLEPGTRVIAGVIGADGAIIRR